MDIRTLRSIESLYVSLPAGWSLALLAPLLSLMRLINPRCDLIFHHHSSLIVKSDEADGRLVRRLYRLLSAIPARAPVHICLYDAMAVAASSNLRGRAVVVSNALFVTPSHDVVADTTVIDIDPHLRLKGKFVIGHLSNLSFEKGLGEVLELASTHLPAGAVLLLAGPAGRKETEAIARVQIAYPDSILWLGPVDGLRKEAFFSSIDCFVFPSSYRHEAAPMVVLEALSRNVPVVATDVGGVGELVGDGGVLYRDSRTLVEDVCEWFAAIQEFRDAGRPLAAFESQKNSAELAWSSLWSL